MKNRYKELTPLQQMRVDGLINEMASGTKRRGGNGKGWYEQLIYRLDNPETFLDWTLCVTTVLAAVAGFFGFLFSYAVFIETYLR